MEKGGLQMTIWQGGRGGERGEAFPPPLGQGGAAQYAEGHVGAHPLPDLGQLRPGQPRPGQLVHGVEDGGGVGAPPGQPGAHRDMLADGHIHLAPQAGGGAEGGGSYLGQVFSPGGQKVEVGHRRPRPAPGGGDGELIRQGDGLHHHLQIVVAVLPFAEYVQGEVDFGAG